jgi:hypothetical protein
MSRRRRARMSRIEMRIQPNDILLAFKAIALSEKLNGTEKQVGAFLVDSFNRRTGQCDPSVDTQAVLSTKSRRTMFRAIDRLVRLRFFRRIRHGGKHNRNSYQPNWEHFRGLERAYKERRRQHANRYVTQNLSPSGCQECHSSDVNIGIQTCPTNTIPQTYKRCPSSLQHSDLNGEGLGNKSTANTSARAHASFRQSPSSKEAARHSAERRWNKNLLDRFRHTSVYATILEALDIDLQAAATQVEMERVGAGTPHILQELMKRKVLSGTGC